MLKNMALQNSRSLMAKLADYNEWIELFFFSLKTLITTAADGILIIIIIFFYQRK